MSIMVTRMMLSLKRTAVKGVDQDWELFEKSGSMLEPPSTSRTVRGSIRFSDPVSHAKLGSVIPIPMEIIQIKDERHHV